MIGEGARRRKLAAGDDLMIDDNMPEQNSGDRLLNGLLSCRIERAQNAVQRPTVTPGYGGDDRSALSLVLGPFRPEDAERSEERRVGKECGSTGRSRGAPYP